MQRLPTMDAPLRKERWELPALDSLRGIAVLGVVLVHSVYWSPTRTLLTHIHFLNRVFFSGQRGVQLFFLASAFTLYLSHDNRRQELHPIRNFYLRRIFRITPMFYVATLVALLVWRAPMGPASHITLSMLYLNGLIPDAISHGAIGSWSIATEAMFYAMLPLGFRYVRTAGRAAMVVAAGVAFRWLIPSISPPLKQDFWLFLSLPANICVFGLGIVLFFLWRDVLRSRAVTLLSRRWSAVMLAIAGSLFLEQPLDNIHTLFYGSVVEASLVVALLMHPWKLLVNRFTIFLGKISFSLYLLHFYVAHFLELGLDRYQSSHGLAWHPGFLVATVFIGTLVGAGLLSTFTWRFIELPCVLMGKRLIERMESKPLPGVFAEEQF